MTILAIAATIQLTPPAPAPRRSQRVRHLQSNGAHCINPDAINLVVGHVMLNAHPALQPNGNAFCPTMEAPMMHGETIEEVANRVVHPVTMETITKY